MNFLHLAWAYFRRRPILIMAASGIALGVAMVFATLAVVNGFLSELQSTIRQLSGDVVVRPLHLGGGDAARAGYQRVLLEVDGVTQASPRLNWFGLVGRRGAQAVSDPRSADLNGLLLMGVDPDTEAADPGLPFGLLAASDPPPLLLGDRAAEGLGLTAGDVLEIVSYQGGGSEMTPVQASFRVAGTFHTGQYEQDLDRAFVRRADLAQLAGVAFGATEFVLRGAPGLSPDALAARVSQALIDARLLDADVQTWRAQAGKYLDAIQNQRGILSLLFFVIVLVAAYELFATLILTVAEKRGDMGVLGALGAGPARVAGFFVALCLVIACIGTVLGVLLGIWLSGHLELIERWIGGDQPIFNPELYQFDHIPVALDSNSVGVLVLGTLAAALIASVVPAWLAVRTPIVRALQA